EIQVAAGMDLFEAPAAGVLDAHVTVVSDGHAGVGDLQLQAGREHERRTLGHRGTPVEAPGAAARRHERRCEGLWGLRMLPAAPGGVNAWSAAPHDASAPL